ncbi:hypothetical protein OC842_007849, partial [Tilletia horrida]
MNCKSKPVRQNGGNKRHMNLLSLVRTAVGEDWPSLPIQGIIDKAFGPMSQAGVPGIYILAPDRITAYFGTARKMLERLLDYTTGRVPLPSVRFEEAIKIRHEGWEGHGILDTAGLPPCLRQHAETNFLIIAHTCQDTHLNTRVVDMATSGLNLKRTTPELKHPSRPPHAPKASSILVRAHAPGGPPPQGAFASSKIKLAWDAIAICLSQCPLPSKTNLLSQNKTARAQSPRHAPGGGRFTPGHPLWGWEVNESEFLHRAQDWNFARRVGEEWRPLTAHDAHLVLTNPAADGAHSFAPKEQLERQVDLRLECAHRHPEVFATLTMSGMRSRLRAHDHPKAEPERTALEELQGLLKLLLTTL